MSISYAVSTHGAPENSLLRCSELRSADAPALHLLVESAVASFVSDWITIDFKFDDYGGNFNQLPKRPADQEGSGNAASAPLDHIFEVDTEWAVEDGLGLSGGGGGGGVLDASRTSLGATDVIKKGFLQKGEMQVKQQQSQH